MRLITLTTDFGFQDWFVGAMKGVILGIAPRTRVVDLTHGIPRGDIGAGAFALAAACQCFPPDTIHVAVVDPGVGGPRAGIAVQTASHVWVGPDNGVLSIALQQEKIRSVRRLENDAFFRHPVSRTFHGRDLFAPVAAHLSRGVPISRLGPAQADLVRLPWPSPKRQGNRWRGEIVYIDRFGNAITNLPTDPFGERGRLTVSVRRQTDCPVMRCYEEGPAGQLIGVCGSAGFLELAVKNRSAAEAFQLMIGDAVRCGGHRSAKSRRLPVAVFAQGLVKDRGAD